MMVRCGFVSNSSSSSFIIKNTLGEEKTFDDFFVEIKKDLQQFLEEEAEYGSYYSSFDDIEEFLKYRIDKSDIKYREDGSIKCIFGNECGTTESYTLECFLIEKTLSGMREWNTKSFVCKFGHSYH